MNKQLLVKSAHSIFIIGLLVFAILSAIGLVYLSQMAFTNKKDANGKYCGGLNETQRNIARLAVIALWVQFAWIVAGSTLQSIWD
jgi:hypothetical protein